MKHDKACIACGSRDWRSLLDWPQGMLSDGKLLPYPLHKRECAGCGLVARQADCMPAGAWQSLFTDDYALHATPPNAYDLQRATAYADWLLPMLRGESPRTALEVGCGNGALLGVVRERLDLAMACGLDPNPAAIAVGQAQGLNLLAGTLEDAAWRAGPWAATGFDLVYSVNVIEHVDDPLAFLQSIHRQLDDDGRLLLVCPDGDLPSSELLMFDHVHSFTHRSLQVLLQAAGFSLLCHEVSPAGIAGFQAVLAAPFLATDAMPEPEAEHLAILHGKRAALVAGWHGLAEYLLPQVPTQGRLVAFGVGEAAMLLRAYAPALWHKVDAVTADVAPPAGRFSIPFMAMSALNPQTDTLLLATRAEVQATLASRFAEQGFRVIRTELPHLP